MRDWVSRLWLIGGLFLVFLSLYLVFAYIKELAVDLFIRKTFLASYALFLGYVIRRQILGKIEWKDVWLYVYAIVIHIIVGFAIIFG